MKLVKLNNKLTSYHVNFRMNYFMCLLYSFVYFSMFCNIRGKKKKKKKSMEVGQVGQEIDQSWNITF